jgi:flotillin
MESLFAVGLIAFVGVIILIAFFLRRVVDTNEVHIVQSARSTKSFGRGTEAAEKNGNVYYEWPYFLPLIGVTKTVLPISVFDLTLDSYDAYDKGRVPFVVDIVAFFRVENSTLAAQRVASFQELKEQLAAIVKGAIRTVLAQHEIDSIMIERSKFGEQFTLEVQEQLKSWGVTPVKNIELMDIRDLGQNKVIFNIMEKKKSLIEMQSRQEVAENMKNAQVAEIEAQREADVQKQVAEEQVGLRTAQKEQNVGVAREKSNQGIAEEARVTKEKQMEVQRVGDTKRAEIAKQVKVIEAEQVKQTTVIIAQGNLEQQKHLAEGIKVEGDARGAAETAIQMATVNPQITLAKSIASDKGYQEYLVSIRQVEALQAVGIEQARALEKSTIKIVATAGSPADGLNNVRELFNAKGGSMLGAMLEGFMQTEAGQSVMSRIGIKPEADPKSPGAK